MAAGPYLRALLGLVLPGLGQMALGQRFRGLWFLLGVGVLFLAGVLISGGIVTGHTGFWPWWHEYVELPAAATSPLGGFISDLLHVFMLAYPVAVGLGCFAVGLLLNPLSLHLGGNGAMEQDVAFSLLIAAALLNLLILVDAWDRVLHSGREGSGAASTSEGASLP